MTETGKKSGKQESVAMKITVTKNGPYIVTGGVPLIQMEICNDDEGYCRTWREVKRFPLEETYALCRCGHSENKPFCTGMHAKIGFDGTETAGNEPYLRHPRIIRGPDLELLDYENLCVHARFCMRAGGIWNLTKQSDNPEAREIAIEEACNCPSGQACHEGPGDRKGHRARARKIHCHHRVSPARGTRAALGAGRHPGGIC